MKKLVGKERLPRNISRAISASTISSKGQITVPRDIRNHLGLKEGDRVEFVVENDRTTIRPACTPENPFAKYVGALTAFLGVHEVNAWVQTLRGEETQEQ
jgi:AbrB family looped-hinge helix DNA binding protein